MDTGENSDFRDTLSSELGDTGASGAPAPLPPALSPGGVHGAPQGGQPLVFGKYKDMGEAEKGFKSLNGELTKHSQSSSQRDKILKQMLGNQALRTLATSDPQLKDALTQAGYALAEVEEKQEQAQDAATGQKPWDGNTNSAEYRVAVLERKLELRDQRMELERELKRSLKADELSEIKEVMKTVSPNMPMSLAWKLTKAFEAEVKANHDKELAKVRGPQKPQGNRPPPLLLPTGQKNPDVKKRPSQQSAAEKREAMLETARRTM